MSWSGIEMEWKEGGNWVKQLAALGFPDNSMRLQAASSVIAIRELFESVRYVYFASCIKAKVAIMIRAFSEYLKLMNHSIRLTMQQKLPVTFFQSPQMAQGFISTDYS